MNGWLRWCLVLGMALWGAQCSAEPGAAERLRTQFAALRASSAESLFEHAVYLQSSEESGSSHGDVYAMVDHPFADLREALTPASHWCAVLILHLNVQDCHADESSTPAGLKVGLGRKTEQPLSDLYWVNFSYEVAEASADHLHIVLHAASGPLGTREFRIELEAAPAEAQGRSIIHMTYGYAYGFGARLAMQTYLSTIGRDKVGFSTAGQDASGKPEYVGGMRGVLERNTVRYYLAIKSYFDARRLPQDQQAEASLKAWFDATERYPQQLHELGRSEYLEMKLRQIKRQEAPQS